MAWRRRHAGRQGRAARPPERARGSSPRRGRGPGAARAWGNAAALEHDPDAAAERGVVADGVQPEHPHLAGGGAAVALERLDHRRLAGAVGPEHDEHLAQFGGQVDAVDGGGRAGGSVAHGEAGDPDGWHGVAGYFEQE